MPRRFFRKIRLNRDNLRGRWWVAPFDHLLHDPNLWGIRRRTVVPGFALGLFIACLPIPGHILAAIVLAALIGVNVPVAAISTLVANPVTMGPMYYFGFEVGNKLLGLPSRPFKFELSFAWLADRLATTWQPLLLGCLLLGFVLASIGYVALDLLWRASISDYLAKRRQRRQRRRP